MIGERIEITGRLEVLTPLHIGTGEWREVEREGNKKKVDPKGDGKQVAEEKATMQVAAIARDQHNDPYLPGSTLKGVLRRVFDDKGIFGPKEIRDPDDSARDRKSVV